MVGSEHETQWLKHNGKVMVRELGVHPGNVVVDFGCGEGRYSIPLSQAVGADGAVYSVERDDDPLRVFKERLPRFASQDNISIQQSNHLGVSSIIGHNSVDAVFLFDVLQYVSDWKRLFSELANVLKKGGMLHVYPAAVPHPGSVEIEMVKEVLMPLGYRHVQSKTFEMMHNVDIVEDVVHSFSLR